MVCRKAGLPLGVGNPDSITRLGRDTRGRAPRARTTAEVAAYLRSLPRLWDDAPDSRRGLVESLIERVEVLGLRRMHLEPTPAAVAAELVEAFASASAGYGRGERI